jgi:hypothetical protein
MSELQAAKGQSRFHSCMVGIRLKTQKCDETLPFCNRCTSYGYMCNYDRRTPDLQMYCDQELKTRSRQLLPNKIITCEVTKLLETHQSSVTLNNMLSFGVNDEMLGRLARFQQRTVLSVGSESSARIFQKVTANIVFSVSLYSTCYAFLTMKHPYIMHIIQTLTGVHDRQLSAPLTSRQTPAEIYHLYQAASLFNKSLSNSVQESDCDPLWAAAALLGITAFSWIDAICPEEAWPLAEPKSSDLEWIRMSELKPAIWNLTNPLRPSSAFSGQQFNYANINDNKSDGRIEDIPLVFARLYNIDEFSNSDNNPYHAAVFELSPLLQVSCDRPNIILFLKFISHLFGGFRKLLEAKDPRALLLLAYWFAMVCRSVWWIERRSLMEGQAICLYLERYHGEKKRIMDLLQLPKTILTVAALTPLSSITMSKKEKDAQNLLSETSKIWQIQLVESQVSMPQSTNQGPD